MAESLYEKIKTDVLINICKLIVTLSLITGTMIFIIFLLSSQIEIGLFGIYFVIIAVVVNLVILILLIYQFFRVLENRKIILKMIGLVLLNIPIALTYLWITFLWMNTLRITFINETSVNLTNIKVTGCENRIIEELKKGESETLWLNIQRDCGVSIHYTFNGIDKSEDVTGYVTNEGGYSMTFKIGTNQLPYDQDL